MKIHDGARAMVFYIHHVIVEHEFPLVELHHEDHEIRIWLTQQEIVQIFSQDSYAFLDSVLLSLFTLWKQQKTQH
jgi:hypothetical protein